MTGDDLRLGTLFLPGENAIDAHLVIAEELTLADAYRDAQCMGYVQGRGGRFGGPCVGESHVADCPVELAKQEWWAAQDRRRSL